MLLEACVDSVATASTAVRGGAARLELCAELDVGGTTPTTHIVADVLAAARVPVFVIVRPRGGDFAYDDAELTAMRRDIRALAELGAHGIVTGALRRDGTVDADAMRSFLEAAGALPVTFHRAIDVAANASAALDVLMSLGVRRLLTSGGAPTALEGAARIAALVRQAGDALTVMAGGGVRPHNVRDVIARTGVREVHARTTALSEQEVWQLARGTDLTGSLRASP